jgi:predicted lipoprotein with Yx(FWY)xxD motif
MHPSSRWTSMVGLVVGAAFVASACSAAAATPVITDTPVMATPTTAASAGSATLTLASTNDAKLGGYLTGAKGMTLYILTKDTPDTSSCTGTCATNWPPLTVAGGTTVAGPSEAAAPFATSARTDGTLQVTYNHWPLYYFAGDSTAGDTMGQGKNAVWFVAPLSGSLASAAPSAAPSTAPSTTPAAVPSMTSGY